MPLYSYTAKSLKGETRSGTLEAKDEHQLAKILRQKGLVLIEAFSKKEVKKKKLEISLPFLGRVKLTEKMMITRNLGVMIAAGTPLVRALEILSEQAKSKKLKEALSDIIQEITKGGSFSNGLSRHPDIFSELFANMVKVGEETGTLEEVLKVLTRQMERQHELSSSVKGALIYPAVIISAMMGIGILMLIIVVPELAKTFEELGIELPIATKAVITIGVFLSNYWYLLPLIILTFLGFLRGILKTTRGKKVIDGLFLKLPIVSPIIKGTNSANALRSFSSLLTAGVPIVRSLEIVSGALGNIYFKEVMAEAAKKVRKGAKLSECLRPYQHIYPLLMIQMIEIGEETGQTSSILEKLADFFEQEVANATKNLSAVIEPLLMLLIGGAVGFFAIAMIQPMYSMLGAI